MDDSQSADNMEEVKKEEESVFGAFANANEFSQSALRAALQATKSSNELPSGDNFDFYSTYRSVRDVMDIEGRRVLTLLQRLLRHQSVKGSVMHGAGPDIEDKFDTIMDANDQILERAGASLDEASGIRKDEAKLVISSASFSPSGHTTSWNKKPTPTTATKSAATAYRLLTARNIQRPQLQFKDSIDNTHRPFRPLLRTKPHATLPLEESLQLPPSVTLEDAERPDFCYPHPYKTEIEALSPGGDALEKVNPQEPPPLSLTPLIHVDSEAKLAQLVQHLATQTEIAVDLEHHAYRSFQGLTCLMQISTRSHDYIVDTLLLRPHIHQLNVIFTDPKITKVLHGADFDVLWLQRDFGVYLVNMFDTGQAARVLGLSRFSLAHLMLTYCKVEADKQFQLADWRIRPLPEELIKYSREDTHYLLYIYDRMRNQLLDQGNAQANLLVSVYQRSAEVALKVYQKPVFHSEDYRSLYLKSKKVFNSQQLAALKDLSAWRDHMARVEDESLGYVLPTHMLLQICEILPRERQGVLACCNPIPPLVRQSLPEIHGMVLQAREVVMAKPDKPAPVVSEPSRVLHPMYKADSILCCPHDLSSLDHRIAQTEHSIAETGRVNSGAATTDPRLMLKDRPDIAAFTQPRVKRLTRTLGHKLARDVRALFSNPFKKYFPVEDSAPVKPKAAELWHLKPPTGAKRQAGEGTGKVVELDDFQPEFVQPTKRAKVAVNLLSSKTQGSRATPSTTQAKPSASLFEPPPHQASTSGASLFAPPAKTSVFEPPANQSANNTTSNGSDVSGGGVAGACKEEVVERQIKSLRQEVNLKKKKEKKKKAKDEAKKKSSTSASSETLPESSTQSSPSQPKGKGDKELNPPPTMSDGASSSPAPPGLGGEKKKKKKKKKLNMSDVEQNFSGFDYTSAEKQLTKAKKTTPDVYNPSLPSRTGKKDKGQRKAKLSGPNSTKQVIFGGSSAGHGKKK